MAFRGQRNNQHRMILGVLWGFFDTLAYGAGISDLTDEK
jgi:hypothetical protein